MVKIDNGSNRLADMKEDVYEMTCITLERRVFALLRNDVDAR